MGKLKTTLVNDTNKTLQLFEQTSNGEYTQRPNLLGTRSQPNHTVTVETTESSPRQTNIVGDPDYFVESDPNQTYWTLSVWHGRDVVLSVSSDELIDSAVITIGWDNHEKKFTKDCQTRNCQRTNLLRQLLWQGPPAPMVPDTAGGEASPAPPPHSKVSWWRSNFRRNKH
ncbi:unnamed protein product [Sphagnum balticum]